MWSGGSEMCVMMWDVVWCVVPEMWFDVKSSWAVVVRCGMYNTLPLLLAPRHIIATTFFIASFHIQRHLWHYFKPHHIPHHAISPHHIAQFVSHQHLSQYTIPLCNTIRLQIAPYRPHLAFHPVSHYVLRNATFHVLHATFQIIYRPRYAYHHIPHHTTFYATLHRAISRAPHLHNCITPRHLTVITPTIIVGDPPTIIVHHHLLQWSVSPLTTSRITPPPLPRIAQCRSPHSASFHIAQRSTFHPTAHTLPHSTSHKVLHSTPQPTLTSFHITQSSTFHATAHTLVHITPQLSITLFQFERLELYVIRFMFTYNLLRYHMPNPTKMGGEKVVTVYPNTNLLWVVVYLIVTLHTN